MLGPCSAQAKLKSRGNNRIFNRRWLALRASAAASWGRAPRPPRGGPAEPARRPGPRRGSGGQPRASQLQSCRASYNNLVQW